MCSNKGLVSSAFASISLFCSTIHLNNNSSIENGGNGDYDGNEDDEVGAYWELLSA